MSDHAGVVVIGRNEGERLRRCLSGLSHTTDKIVYVDSGSTDDSVQFAASIGIDVQELDTDLPFSAARARNLGANRLASKYPNLQYVQFVDGDCTIDSMWLQRGEAFLCSNAQCAVVFGKGSEEYPEATLYNRLLNIEWNTPAGECLQCGGISMMRMSSFQSAGGFNPQVVAGEEPELCYRLRQKKHSIWCLDENMMRHDANMTSFWQWWKRSVRSGHAYAQGAIMHGMHPPEHFCVRDSIRIWLWALVGPLMIGLVVSYIGAPGLALLTIYPIQVHRIASTVDPRIASQSLAYTYALFMMIAKWPQLYGQLVFLTKMMRGKSFEVMEYK